MRSKTQPKTNDLSKVKFKDMYTIVSDVMVKMERPAGLTSFKLDETEIFENLVQQIRRDCPSMVGKIDAGLK